jgi:hypothetical protein
MKTLGVSYLLNKHCVEMSPAVRLLLQTGFLRNSKYFHDISMIVVCGGNVVKVKATTTPHDPHDCGIAGGPGGGSKALFLFCSASVETPVLGMTYAKGSTTGHLHL